MTKANLGRDQKGKILVAWEGFSFKRHYWQAEESPEWRGSPVLLEVIFPSWKYTAPTQSETEDDVETKELTKKKDLECFAKIVYKNWNQSRKY